MVVSLELRLTTKPPAGAGAVSWSVRLFVVAVPWMINVVGVKVAAEPTVTCWLAEPTPEACAVIVAVPNPWPEIFGVTPDIWPCEIKMALGEIVTLLVSLLDRLTKAPPAGAGAERVTG